MTTYLFVALGSAIGGVSRFWLSAVIAEKMGVLFPWGTLVINITGSLLIGLFSTMTVGEGILPLNGDTRAFLMVGICGGYTTFSSFSLQTLGLLQAGQIMPAAMNMVGSVVLCLLAVWIGHWAGTVIR